MDPLSRRDFFEVAAALAALLGTDGSTHAGPQKIAPIAPTSDDAPPMPNFAVVNARVHTMDLARPRAEAFVVANGRFRAVGRSADVQSMAGPGIHILDAAGATILPGFIDTHSHPSGVQEISGVNVNLRTVEEVKAALRRKAADTPPGYWVTGYMYDDTKLDRPVTRRDLDDAVPNHAARIGHRGGHTGVYNSLAFKLAGVTAQTPDPSGGRFFRAGGELTGTVAAAARNAFNGIARSEPVTRDMRRRGIAHITREMAKSGITSVHWTGGSAADLTALQDASAAGELFVRMYLFARSGFFDRLRESGIRTGFGDEWVRIGGVKFTADGSASERTMRMSTPYVGRPDDYGILYMNQEELDQQVETAHRAGWQIGIHANGDVAIDMVLRAYERAQREWPRPDPRHRIEHCSLVNEDLLRRIKALGVIPTPFYTYIYYHGDKWAEYGEDRMRWMFAHRSFLDHDIPVAGASDYMPGPFEPMMALQSLVTRRDYAGREWGPNQRVTVAEALRICTVNGARASFEEASKGSIAEGKLADFVMLAEDPHGAAPDTLKDIRVLRTVIGGRTMYEA